MTGTREPHPFEPPHPSVVEALHTLWCAGFRGKNLKRKLKSYGVELSTRDIERTLNHIMETRVQPYRACASDIPRVNAWLRKATGGKWGRLQRV